MEWANKFRIKIKRSGINKIYISSIAALSYIALTTTEIKGFLEEIEKNYEYLQPVINSIIVFASNNSEIVFLMSGLVPATAFYFYKRYLFKSEVEELNAEFSKEKVKVTEAFNISTKVLAENTLIISKDASEFSKSIKRLENKYIRRLSETPINEFNSIANVEKVVDDISTDFIDEINNKFNEFSSHILGSLKNSIDGMIYLNYEKNYSSKTVLKIVQTPESNELELLKNRWYEKESNLDDLYIERTITDPISRGRVSANYRVDRYSHPRYVYRCLPLKKAIEDHIYVTNNIDGDENAESKHPDILLQEQGFNAKIILPISTNEAAQQSCTYTLHGFIAVFVENLSDKLIFPNDDQFSDPLVMLVNSASTILEEAFDKVVSSKLKIVRDICEEEYLATYKGYKGFFDRRQRVDA